ncbi:sodium-independent sulfate anion transporter-like isoform X1 [Crassostrea angulata]|uniref:sodium-independent sulfate anion transporter-like isoform X1 n=1 Tax=Magallana angulata TaxID=2784310 RepID=UPI0022B1457A|nr:sodium-independent sulfate anion transporter-like isoform X1 [Crassostrea angulata]
MSRDSGEREPLLGNQPRKRAGSNYTGEEGGLSSSALPPSHERETGEEESIMGFTVVVKRAAKKQINACCSKENLKTKLPITKWLPNYSLQALQCDLIAGLTVGLTVIPQGLAYAKIADLPPQYGLYSAFMGCFVYCFLGTAKDITLGPTAIMSLMTATFATSPIEEDATYAIVLCLITGCVQLLLGLLNLGILVNFISYPVINAFTSAAAITIGFGQVKGILGLTHIPRDFPEMVYETCKKIPETKIWDLVMGLVCLALLYVLKKLRTINWNDDLDGPGPNRCVRFCRYLIWLIGTASNAIVVISASGVAAILISQGKNNTLSITGHLKPGLPDFKPPDFSYTKDNITITASTIFSDIGAGFGIVPLLGLVELIAIGKAFARQNHYKIYPSQELIAIGFANIISCFVGSYPVTGSFSRTAVNSQSGVKTPASGIFTGVLIVLALFTLTPLFYYIPKSALSAVIIFSVIQMVDVMVVKKLWKTNKIDLIPLFITFLSCLGVGMEYGILIGIGVSMIILLYPSARPKIKVEPGGVKVVKLDQGLLFPAVEYLQECVLEANEADGKNNSVVLDCSHVSALDYTAIQGITELIVDFKSREAKLVFAGFPKNVLKHLQVADIPELTVSSTVQEGCKLLQEELTPEFPGVQHIKVEYNSRL